MWNLRYDTNEPVYETETESQTQTADCWWPRAGCWGRDGEGGWGWQMYAFVYRIDKQQGHTVQHRELHSVSYDKP